MPLSVVRKRGKPGLWITGTVQGVRVRRRAQSDNPKLAREEATLLETDILRSAWHGKRPGLHTLGQAVVSYTDHEARSEGDKARINRLLRAAGDVPLHSLDQEAVDRLRAGMLKADPAPSTVVREIITPLRAILMHAHRRGWCDVPRFDAPAVAKGRTAFLLPEQFETLRDAAADHIRPLLTFLVGTGARLGETLGLEWSEVDLAAARARFWGDQTKAGISYVKHLPPAVVAALAALPHRDGRVFRPVVMQRGGPVIGAGYPLASETGAGGQIGTAWAGAWRRAGLPGAAGGPHLLRHTWASWHYAVHRDLLRLKSDGGWSSVVLVERYAHLLPAGHEDAIRRVWGMAKRLDLSVISA